MVTILPQSQCVKTACKSAMSHLNAHKISGPRFNIKTSSYQYRKSHCGDKTVVRSSYLHNGISYTGKMSSLCWIRALEFSVTLTPGYQTALPIGSNVVEPLFPVVGVSWGICGRQDQYSGTYKINTAVSATDNLWFRPLSTVFSTMGAVSIWRCYLSSKRNLHHLERMRWLSYFNP